MFKPTLLSAGFAAVTTLSLFANPAAAAEPPALWERGRIRVDVAGAQAVLHDLETELSKLIAIDILGHQLRDSPTAWPQFETTLCDIERRIGELCGTKASES